jgi:1-acyl-sn-glycerol-3-phosphate acyltransferase
LIKLQSVVAYRLIILKLSNAIMKPISKLLFFIYQWIVAFPILLVITILVALSTTLLSPILPDSKLSYHPARFWARISCRILFVKVRVRGLELLNPGQSYVFALNHQSVFDIFVIYGWMPFIFKWLMKAELRKIPFVGKACEAAGHIFINRSSSVAAKRSLENVEAHLRNGISLVVFPEGTRTTTGEMGKFKRGAFLVATNLGLPVVPVTLRGSFERIQRNTLNVVPGTIELIIHQPIDVLPFLPNNDSVLIARTWDVVHSAL